MRKLGRGLDSLIESTELGRDEFSTTLVVSEISPNAFQPRERFDDETVEELARSIEEHGVLQPILVRRCESGYELIAGERRWRACRRLGLERIPAIVRNVDDDRMLEIALVENVQREDLNAIEKARAYRRFVSELSLTHEEVARRLGKDRSTITNQLRLLELSDDLQAMVSRGTLSMGHARALLGVPDEARRRLLAHKVEEEGLSVRGLEQAARLARAPAVAPPKSEPKPRSAHFEDLERQLREHFATKAHIHGTKQRGRVTLEYFSMDELTRLLDLLLG